MISSHPDYGGGIPLQEEVGANLAGSIAQGIV